MKNLKRILVFLLLTSTFLAQAKVAVINVDKVHDSARLKLPIRYKHMDKIPLILNLHGLGGNRFLQRLLTRLERQVHSMNVAVLTPQGMMNSEGKRFWNASHYCCDYEETQINDVEYLEKIVKKSLRLYPMLDASRVIIVGHSNGGFMAYRMVCEHPEMFKGVISIAGSMDLRDREGNLLPEGDPCPDQAGHKLNIVQVHGTADEVVPYAGLDNEKSGHVSVDRLLSGWRTHNQCVDSIEGNYVLNPRLFHRERSGEFISYSCLRGKLALVKLNGAGHIPVLRRRLYKRLLNFVLE